MYHACIVGTPEALRSPFLCSTFAEPPPPPPRAVFENPRANGERREEGRSRSLFTWVRSELSWIPTLGGLLIDGSVLRGLHNEDPRAWRLLGGSKLCEHPLCFKPSWSKQGCAGSARFRFPFIRPCPQQDVWRPRIRLSFPDLESKAES